MPVLGGCWVNTNLDVHGNYMDGTICETKGDCGGLKFAYMSKEDCMSCGWRPFEKPQKEGIVIHMG